MKRYKRIHLHSQNAPQNTEEWQSGRMRRSWKPLNRKVPGVRIPPPLQAKNSKGPGLRGFFIWAYVRMKRSFDEDACPNKKWATANFALLCLTLPLQGITVSVIPPPLHNKNKPRAPIYVGAFLLGECPSQSRFWTTLPLLGITSRNPSSSARQKSNTIKTRKS